MIYKKNTLQLYDYQQNTVFFMKKSVFVKLSMP